MTKKRVLFLGLCSVLCAVFVILCGCSRTKKNTDLQSTASRACVVDDTSALKDVLTKKYDIEELKEFFKNSYINEGDRLNPLFSTLTFEEVNAKFPVEVFRSNYYSVYKVTQGGYFYVFWIPELGAEVNKLGDGLAVYFCAYLDEPGLLRAFDTRKRIKSFDALIPGISTAADVRRIDPSFELYLLYSHGTYSYSYIDEETIVQVKYARENITDGYNGYVVSEKEIVSRDSVYSCYGAILPGDLP